MCGEATVIESTVAHKLSNGSLQAVVFVASLDKHLYAIKTDAKLHPSYYFD